MTLDRDYDEPLASWWESLPANVALEYLNGDKWVLTGVYGRKKRRSEEANDYPNIIFEPCPDWRVIICRDAIQWILQRFVGGRWRSQSYCRTKAGLTRCIRERQLAVSPAAQSAIDHLPAVL